VFGVCMYVCVWCVSVDVVGVCIGVRRCVGVCGVCVGVCVGMCVGVRRCVCSCA
jgi:hypothetical protein